MATKTWTVNIDGFEHIVVLKHLGIIKKITVDNNDIGPIPQQWDRGSSKFKFSIGTKECWIVLRTVYGFYYKRYLIVDGKLIDKEPLNVEALLSLAHDSNTESKPIKRKINFVKFYSWVIVLNSGLMVFIHKSKNWDSLTSIDKGFSIGALLVGLLGFTQVVWLILKPAIEHDRRVKKEKEVKKISDKS